MFRFLSNLKDLYKYRVLIQNLVTRELKARYRGTILGFLWSFINPLLLMIVYSVVFGYIIMPRIPVFQDSTKLYALFMFCGVLPWQVWFVASCIESANILMVQGNLIKKVLFPAEILPVVVVTSNFIHFLFGLPILLAFIPIMGAKFTPYILQLPLVMLVQMVFTLGFAFLVSSLTVHFRDIKDILVSLLTFWFFATPIIYPMSFFDGPERKVIRTLLNLNPMAHIMEGYQNSVFFGKPLYWNKLGITLLLSIVLFIVGYYIFDRLRDSFPEEV